MIGALEWSRAFCVRHTDSASPERAVSAIVATMRLSFVTPALAGIVLLASCGPGNQSLGQTPCRENNAQVPATAAPGSEPLVRAGSFEVGDRVSCNWQSGGTYYDGAVGELRPGGRIFIRYDDGDVEETTPEMCHALGAAPEPRARIGAARSLVVSDGVFAGKSVLVTGGTRGIGLQLFVIAGAVCAFMVRGSHRVQCGEGG